MAAEFAAQAKEKGITEAEREKSVELAWKADAVMCDLAGKDPEKEKWTVMKELPQVNGRVYRIDGGGTPIFVGIGTLPFESAALEALLHDAARHKEWDPEADEFTVIDQCTPDARLVYISIPGFLGGMISARDFVQASTLRRAHADKGEEPGSLISGASSIEIASLPNRPSVVRANNISSGWHMRPVDGGMRVLYILRSDIGGWVPRWTVEKALPANIQGFFDNVMRVLGK